MRVRNPRAKSIAQKQCQSLQQLVRSLLEQLIHSHGGRDSLGSNHNSGGKASRSCHQLCKVIVEKINKQLIPQTQYKNILNEIGPQLLRHSQLVGVVLVIVHKMVDRGHDLAPLYRYITVIIELVKSSNDVSVCKLCHLLVIILSEFVDSETVDNSFNDAIVGIRDYTFDVVTPLLISNSHCSQQQNLHSLFVCCVKLLDQSPHIVPPMTITQSIISYVKKYGLTRPDSLDVLTITSNPQTHSQIIEMYQNSAQYWLTHLNTVSEMEVHNLSVLLGTYPHLPESLTRTWVQLLLRVTQKMNTLMINGISRNDRNHQGIGECVLAMFDGIVNNSMMYHEMRAISRLCLMIKGLKWGSVSLLGLLSRLKQWITKMQIGFTYVGSSLSTIQQHKNNRSAMETENSIMNPIATNPWVPLKCMLIQVFLKFNSQFHKIWLHSSQMPEELTKLQAYCLQYWHHNQFSSTTLIAHQEESMQLYELAMRYNQTEVINDHLSAQLNQQIASVDLVNGICRLAIEHSHTCSIWALIQQLAYQCIFQCLSSTNDIKCDYLILCMMLQMDIAQLKIYNQQNHNVVARYCHRHYLSAKNPHRLYLSARDSHQTRTVTAYTGLAMHGVHFDDISPTDTCQLAKSIIINSFSTRFLSHHLLTSIGEWLTKYTSNSNNPRNNSLIDSLNRKLIIRRATAILESSQHDSKWKQYINSRLQLFYSNIENSIIGSRNTHHEMSMREQIARDCSDNSLQYLLRKYLPEVLSVDEFKMQIPHKAALKCVNNRIRPIYRVSSKDI